MDKKYKQLQWTQHSKVKMRQYSLSKIKLINLLYKPERKEQGIVPGTRAVMQTNKKYSKNTKKAPGEIWLMYKDVKDTRKIISAWRYPGVSKPGEEIPIPNDIRQELIKENAYQ